MKLSITTALAIFGLSTAVSAHGGHGRAPGLFHHDGVINLENLQLQLAACPVVEHLNTLKAIEEANHEESIVEWFFEKLFPFGPAANALLATAYISGPPNFILALIPASIDPSSLSLLVSFAIGGLLGDVFLHLLPQVFMGEPVDGGVQFMIVDEKRNTILGVFIFVGFVIFMIIDKSLRILAHTGDGESHGHGHSHTHASSSAVEEKESGDSTLRQRKRSVEDAKASEPVIAQPNASVKTSAYLNLISDFTHNITDGLAIAGSFYISKSVGSTTALAVFFHEIPHEIGDFALLIQGGFTKWEAMNSQFITAVGAFLGTFIGIGIQRLGKSSAVAIAGEKVAETVGGLWGTTVQIGDLTIPFTAGGFLYIATVGVIPEILELGSKTTRWHEAKKSVAQLVCMMVGILLMFGISWME
ncbi:hypothetical protein BABINDRAFT_172202 [Babjeviella inositovora NRRL Y-12698]|uniref:Uncharacterized protein n=1 Tax=Babjeviella inositovora NRRL Y-12698 TaxID=984486 RepID=A0A1E3QL20_9ASCO|nr:uncharacterized protein BABINDRAFT_172202 [Babjeviella inositovora NRRL Y-12698]ODQ78381.1 hypothetical protein BABINDRAFT_172202 [Babjeviella inositovora NRRL Y-12698]